MPELEATQTRKEPAMPTTEARIRTDRAGRYLTQLCSHTAQLSVLPHGHQHGEGVAMARPRRVEYSDANGVIEFERGRCALQADGEELVLLAEADDQQDLRLIQDAIGERLQRIGRRDRLGVIWTPRSGEPGRRDPGIAAIIAQLMTPAGRADPFPLYATAHRLGPVAALADGSFVVTGYPAVDQVLREPGFGLADTLSPDSQNDALRLMNRSILRTNPPDHGRMRSLISKVFTPRRIAAQQPAIEAAVDDLLVQFSEAVDGGSTDFMDHVAFPLPVTVICELLGVPPRDRRRFRPLAADLTEALELSGDTSPHADAAARKLAEYFVPMIADRQATPGDDLISALVAAPNSGDGRLSDEELLANLILLLVAGFETTTNLLGNGLAILLDRPDLITALRGRHLPIAGFIEEVLRYDSPVQAVTRRAHRAGLTVEGVPIPEGADLILLLGAANRDPARYDDPDRFDPARTDIRPLSFGAGPHICIGNNLARLEAALTFPKLLDRFPNLSAVPDRTPLRRDRLVLRGFQTLPVQITTR